MRIVSQINKLGLSRGEFDNLAKFSIVWQGNGDADNIVPALTKGLKLYSSWAMEYRKKGDAFFNYDNNGHFQDTTFTALNTIPVMLKNIVKSLEAKIN